MDTYSFIYGKPYISAIFTYSETFFSLILLKSPNNFLSFLSLKFRKGKTSQKLRAVKENVSVKNTGAKILLQFSGDNPRSGSGGRSNST